MSAPVWVILPTYDEAATLEPVVRGREHSRSKMSARIALEAAWVVPALRFARDLPTN